MALTAFGTREMMQGQYLVRSTGAMFGLYGNTAAEAYYPKTEVDSEGLSLDSENDYKIVFSKDRLPPVKSFWSITIYSKHNYLLVPNGDDETPARYAIGDRTKKLNYGEDGSLTIYIRKNAPEGDKRNNWLPAPNPAHDDWPDSAGTDTRFYLVARLYQPGNEALDPSAPYAPPNVEKDLS